MHIAVAAVALLLFTAAGEARAQGYGMPAGPKLGEIEVKVYQKIPKAKVAVQLTSDTHLSRELRREVMIRLSRRGNEVGFSGGNVMRLDVSYFDFSTNRGGGGSISGPRSYTDTGPGFGTDQGPSSFGLFKAPINPSGSAPTPSSAPTLRITLTLYSTEGGKVLWTASGSCASQADMAQRAGEAIINHMFDNADKSLVGDAGCPL
jgi:hypothetical protein